jgi:hypothetical protein
MAAGAPTVIVMLVLGSTNSVKPNRLFAKGSPVKKLPRQFET